VAPPSFHLEHQLPSRRTADLAHRMAVLHQVEGPLDSESSTLSEVRCGTVVSDECSLIRSALDEVDRLSFTEMHCWMFTRRGQAAAESADGQKVGRRKLHRLTKPGRINHGLKAWFRRRVADDLPAHSIRPHKAAGEADLEEVESLDDGETPQNVGIQNKKVRHVGLPAKSRHSPTRQTLLQPPGHRVRSF
jgi:hypothetical protein